MQSEQMNQAVRSLVDSMWSDFMKAWPDPMISHEERARAEAKFKKIINRITLKFHRNI